MAIYSILFKCLSLSISLSVCSRSVFDRQWEFRCGTGAGLASVATTCTLMVSQQPVIRVACYAGQLKLAALGMGMGLGIMTVYHVSSMSCVMHA